MTNINKMIFFRRNYLIFICFHLLLKISDIHSFVEVSFASNQNRFLSSPLGYDLLKRSLLPQNSFLCRRRSNILLVKKRADRAKIKKATKEKEEYKSITELNKEKFSSSIDDKRVVLLTDSGSPWYEKVSSSKTDINRQSQEEYFPIWYKKTISMLLEKGWSKKKVETCNLPYIYESNDKRYEQSWLHYMMEELCLDDETFVIAHAASADAVLRYLEEHKLRGVILISPSPFYHAAERHGRDFHFSLIKNNCKFLNIIYHEEDRLLEAENNKELNRFCKELNISEYYLKKVQYKEQEAKAAQLLREQKTTTREKAEAEEGNLVMNKKSQDDKTNNNIINIEKILTESQLFTSFEIRQLKTKFYLTYELLEIEKIITDWLFIEQFSEVNYD